MTKRRFRASKYFALPLLKREKYWKCLVFFFFLVSVNKYLFLSIIKSVSIHMGFRHLMMVMMVIIMLFAVCVMKHPTLVFCNVISRKP